MCSSPKISTPELKPAPPPPPPPSETAELDMDKAPETGGKKKQGKSSLRVQRQAGIGGATAAGLSIPKG